MLCRGDTADPSEPAAHRAEYNLKLEDEREKMKDLNEAREAAEREARERKAAGRHQSFEMQSKMDAEIRRLSFFGRPAQKCRLRKRALQVSRPCLPNVIAYGFVYVLQDTHALAFQH